jgi:hypothetical protein
MIGFPFRVHHLRAGDVVGFSGCSALGVTINLCTWGMPGVSISHVGIVAAHPESGLPLLFESVLDFGLPCVLREQRLDGVQAHNLRARITGHQGKAWGYPLAVSPQGGDSARLTEFCCRHLGDSYDRIGAFRARQAGFGWLERRMRREDLNALFCSEFVAAALREIGIFPTKNASKWSPNFLCRSLVRSGRSMKPKLLKR